MTDQSFCGALFRVPIFDPVNALHIVFAIGKPLVSTICDNQLAIGKLVIKNHELHGFRVHLKEVQRILFHE